MDQHAGGICKCLIQCPKHHKDQCCDTACNAPIDVFFKDIYLSDFHHEFMYVTSVMVTVNDMGWINQYHMPEKDKENLGIYCTYVKCMWHLYRSVLHDDTWCHYTTMAFNVFVRSGSDMRENKSLYHSCFPWHRHGSKGGIGIYTLEFQITAYACLFILNFLPVYSHSIWLYSLN